MAFLPRDEVEDQVLEGRWSGGVSPSVLSQAEERAYGWYRFYKAEGAVDNATETLYLERNALETVTGLPKMPYLRDSRRSVGLDGFRCSQFPNSPAKKNSNW